ncbi:MAG: hypothetical protein PHW04_10795 [Candidatus Wallbacteria bacterium]|nr:hypothetical protein [Candidatus Wallbacteria bacterium]
MKFNLHLKFALVIVLLLGFYSQVFCWDCHFIYLKLVSNALQAGYPLLGEKVHYSALEPFLEKNSSEIRKRLKEFYTWKNKVYPYQQWILTDDGKAALDSTAALTPAQFKLLLGVQEMAFNSITPPELFTEAFGTIVANPATELPFSTWLCCFSDEPDWGMDLYLFNGDPRYGTIPFGDPQKYSSQSAFHQDYNNESFVMYKLMPSLKQSMAFLRFTIFTEMAGIALKSGDLFWAARFLGNSLHYQQDVIVPYHSRVFPNFSFGTAWAYLTASDKEKFIREKTQLLANHQFLYETLVCETLFGRLQCIESVMPDCHGIIMSAANCPQPPAGIGKYLDEFNQSSEKAYYHANAVDTMICDVFPAKLTSDPGYDPGLDQSFDIFEYFNPQIPDYSEKEKKFLLEFRSDLTDTLTATTKLVAGFLSATAKSIQ